MEERMSIGLEFTKVEVEVTATDKITIGPEIGLIAETSIKITIEEEEATIEEVIETTEPTTGIVIGPETETTTMMEIGTIIDKIIEGMIVTKAMEIETRTTLDLEKDIEIGVVQKKVLNPEVAINPTIGIRVEMIIGDKVEIILEKDLNQDQDHVLM